MLMPSIFGEDLFDEDMFHDSWFDFRMPKLPDVDKTLYGKHAKNLMKTDVREKDGKYEVAVDLPGFRKDEIKASLVNGYLTISTEKALNKEDKNEDKKYLRRERYVGSMTRSFYVGDSVKQEDIKAEFKNGVLNLTIPKEETKKIEQQTQYLTIR